MTAAVTVEDVSKRFRVYHERNRTLKAAVLARRMARYEEFWALRDVSISIPHGTAYGLIGENGSGKSTLLKCMARILRPDAGEITVAGKLSALLELGAGFHPDLSGRENVFLNGSILGLSARDLRSKLDDIVEFAGLERFIDSPVKNYSSGMYVRLGFSVAIHVEPAVLLVDEVLAVGDAAFQRRCNEKFADLKAAGVTIVVVSHALDQVRALCDEVAWLEDGKVRQTGAASAVVDEYLGATQEDRIVDEHGSRFGSGEGLITAVELLGGDGKPTSHVATGKPFTVRLRWQADERLHRPVFSFRILGVDGVDITAPTTLDDEAVPQWIEGEGVIDYAVEKLLLLPGTYDVNCSLSADHGLRQLDVRRRAARFDVTPGTPKEGPGARASLGGTWKISGGSSAER